MNGRAPGGSMHDSNEHLPENIEVLRETPRFDIESNEKMNTLADEVREANESAYAYQMEKRKLREMLIDEISGMIKDVDDISKIEKEQVIDSLRKITITELRTIKKNFEKSIKDGMAELRRRIAFIRGSKSTD